MALAAQFVLGRVRDVCDGPILLVKGPEAAIRYPHGARGYGDLDLLRARRRRSSATAARRGVRGDAGPRGRLGRDSPPPARCGGAGRSTSRCTRSRSGRTNCAPPSIGRVAGGGGPLAGGSRGRGGRHPRTRPGAPCTSPRCARLGASAARASTRPRRRRERSAPRRMPRRSGRPRGVGASPASGRPQSARSTGSCTGSDPFRSGCGPGTCPSCARRRSSKTTSSASARRSGRTRPERPRGGSVGRCSARSAPQATRGGARSSGGRSLPSAGRSHRSASIGGCSARRRTEERGAPLRPGHRASSRRSPTDLAERPVRSAGRHTRLRS